MLFQANTLKVPAPNQQTRPGRPKSLDFDSRGSRGIR